MLTSLFLALALTTQGPGPIIITEQQLTEFVNQKVKYEQQYGLPGLFEASLKLDTMDVQLGRQSAGMANVLGSGNFTLTLPNKPSVDGRIKTNFEAKPLRIRKGPSISTTSSSRITPLNPPASSSSLRP